MTALTAALLAFIPLIPGPGEAVAGGAVGAAAFLVAGAAAAAWRRRGGRPGDARKTFHFLIFTTAATLRALGGIGAVTAYGAVVFAGVVAAVLRGEGDPIFEALARPSDAPRRALHVVIPLCATAAGGVLAHLIGGPAATAAYLVGGWGDAVGEPVGIRWGRHRYRVPSIGGVPATRSLEGSAAVLLASWAGAAIGLAAAGASAGTAAGGGLAVAAVAAAVETFTPHGLDNLTVLVAAAATARLLLG